MVSDGFTPRLAGTAEPSTTCRPGVPVHPVVGVDHAGRRRIADHRAAEDVRGHRDVEDVADRAARETADLRGDPAYRVVADRDPGRVRRAVPGPVVSRPRRVRRTVSELSTDCMTSAMIVRSLHRRVDSDRASSTGWRSAWPRKRTGRGTRPPPSTSSVDSRPMALLPGP